MQGLDVPPISSGVSTRLLRDGASGPTGRVRSFGGRAQRPSGEPWSLPVIVSSPAEPPTETGPRLTSTPPSVSALPFPWLAVTLPLEEISTFPSSKLTSPVFMSILNGLSSWVTTSNLTSNLDSSGLSAGVLAAMPVGSTSPIGFPPTYPYRFHPLLAGSTLAKRTHDCT